MARSADIAHLAEIGIPSGTPGPADRTSDRAVTTPEKAVAAAAASPSPDDFDYGADADPDQEVIARAFADLDKLTLQAERLTEQRKRAEDQLAKLKQQEEQLLNKDIPELLRKMRLDDCVTSSGISVKVKRDIRLSLPGHDRVEARMDALRWLVENGHGGIIKNQVSVALDRGEDARADELVMKLRSEGFEVEAKKDVHAMTLSALGRELVAEGKIIPREHFNYFDVVLAKLSRK